MKIFAGIIITSFDIEFFKNVVLSVSKGRLENYVLTQLLLQ